MTETERLGILLGRLTGQHVPSDDCARLMRAIVTRNLELDLEELRHYTVLREQISDSIFRVMTADAMLTNTFWNFYLDPAE